MAARREIARGYERRTVFDYVPARAAGERALELMRGAVGDDAVETADAYDLLGYVYDEIGLFEKGATMFEASLAIRTRAPGVPDLIRDETENNLAWLEMGAGRYADAEKRFRSVAERREKQGGDGLRRAENSRTGQGAALAHLGRFREAEQVQRAAVASAEKRSGPNAGGNSWMLRQLGLTLLEGGQAAEAEALCARTLAMPRHDQWSRLSRATDLRCLASSRAAQGRFDGIEPLFVEALEVCARELGKADTLCAANVLADQGRAENKAGRTQQAREALERAEKVRAAILPATHPELVAVRAELTRLAAR
jgi:tetratricopeptide (TPR) repeat protein